MRFPCKVLSIFLKRVSKGTCGIVNGDTRGTSYTIELRALDPLALSSVHEASEPETQRGPPWQIDQYYGVWYSPAQDTSSTQECADMVTSNLGVDVFEIILDVVFL